MEFTKLSDVEVVETPTDTANVLIEENGVVKKAPKTAVGGAGSSVEYDAVINLGVFSDIESLSDLSGGSVPSGTTAMITEKVNAGEMPKIKGIIAYNYYDVLQYGVFEFTAFGTYGSNQVKCYCDVCIYGIHHSLLVYLRDDEIETIYRSVTIQ